MHASRFGKGTSSSLVARASTRTVVVASLGAAGVVLASASCGATQGSATDDVSEGGAASGCLVTERACEAPTHVGTADALVRIVAALPEVVDSEIAPSTGAARVVSRDLAIDADVELDAEALPKGCGAAGDAGTGSRRRCRDSVGAEQPWMTRYWAARVAKTFPAGVTCVTPAKDGEYDCRRLRLARGAVIRFQRTVYAGFIETLHAVRVLRPCASECRDGEVYCPASKTCVLAGRDACLVCEGAARQVCACRTACGVVPDGESCSYDTSPDTRGGSTCRAGSCE